MTFHSDYCIRQKKSTNVRSTHLTNGLSISSIFSTFILHFFVESFMHCLFLVFRQKK